MIENRVLQDRVVWVKGLDRKQTASWLNFCEKYSGRSKYEGIFVIESYDESFASVAVIMTAIS